MFLNHLDLKGEIFGVDSTLREAACDKPQARLGGRDIHVPQLLPVAKTPDRTYVLRHVLAE